MDFPRTVVVEFVCVAAPQHPKCAAERDRAKSYGRMTTCISNTQWRHGSCRGLDRRQFLIAPGC